MGQFKALRIAKTETGQSVETVAFDDADLMPGDVTVRITHSTVNYKDGLAITGRSPVVRRFPMIPGVDFAGTVETSSHPGIAPGDQVVLNGWGTGETHLGAYAERARVKGEWLVPLPSAFTPAEAMAIGTAGYTAMLSVIAIESRGLTPSDGPAIVTGAAGGVGSVAVALLARLGWSVIASMGRPEEADFLRELGAAEILSRDELSKPGRPLGKERWAAGVDAVGSAYARQCSGANEDEWRDRGLRTRAGRRLAGECHALHPARRVASRHRQRHGEPCTTDRGVGPACPRPRQGKARGADEHDRFPRDRAHRARHPRRQDTRAGRGGDRGLALVPRPGGRMSRASTLRRSPRQTVGDRLA